MDIKDPKVKQAFDLVLERYNTRRKFEVMPLSDLIADVFLLTCQESALNTPQATRLLIHLGMHFKPGASRDAIFTMLRHDGVIRNHLSKYSQRKAA